MEHAESSRDRSAADALGAPNGAAEDLTGPRRPGRPRRWATEAERKRAYRERLAADVAEPARLRDELRAERVLARDLTQRLARVERERDQALRALEGARQREGDFVNESEFLRSRIRQLNELLDRRQ